MVILVLDNPRHISLEDFGVFYEIFIAITYLQFLLTYHRLMNTRQTETTFFTGNRIAFGFYDVCVDHCFTVVLVLGPCIGKRIEIDDQYPYVEPYLGGCQPYAFGAVHRLEHVFNQFFQTGIIGRDVGCHLTQYRLPVEVNR